MQAEATARAPRASEAARIISLPDAVALGAAPVIEALFRSGVESPGAANAVLNTRVNHSMFTNFDHGRLAPVYSPENFARGTA